MSRLWVLCVVVSGCIYTDPINQRPSVGIKREEPTGDVYRGSTVKLTANYEDPEGQIVWFGWRAYACSVDIPEGPVLCDDVPFYTGVLEAAEFIVPKMRADGTTAVSRVQIYLQGQDDYGATSRPTQELLLNISNSTPSVVLRKDARYSYVVDTDINVYGKVSDPDDDVMAQTLAWNVFTPETQAQYELSDLHVDQDPQHLDELQVAKTFHTDTIGDWEIQLVSTDPLGAMFMDHVMIRVEPDHAPCISQVAPIAAPAGSALPLTEPTLFQVNVVTDDLDPFPVTTDPVQGTTELHWSIMAPGASTHEPLTAVDGNAVPLDPANYAPGDIVELRVEIEDRNHTAITCADSAPTCSVITDNACIQRLTWRVEVR